MSLSSVTFSGTLKKDPEKRFTPSNIPVCNITLEITYISRNSQNQENTIASQTVRVNAWRDLAEYCEKNLKAGDKVLVLGKAQINAYTTQDGKKKRDLELDATNIVLINNLLSIELPESPKNTIKNNTETFKKSEDVEQISSIEDAFTSTEEVPF